MIIVQAKVGSVNITTTAKVTPSSSVPEIETDNNVHKVGSPARVTRIPSIAWRTEKKVCVEYLHAFERFPFEWQSKMGLRRDGIMQRWKHSIFYIYLTLTICNLFRTQGRLEREIGERGQRTFSFFLVDLLIFFLCLPPRISIVCHFWLSESLLVANLVPRGRDPFVQRRVAPSAGQK